VAVGDLRVTRAFYLVTHRARSRSPLATAFVEFVESQTAARAS
jgi:DNA-binding transcriptional LysR family regulator